MLVTQSCIVLESPCALRMTHWRAEHVCMRYGTEASTMGYLCVVPARFIYTQYANRGFISLIGA